MRCRPSASPRETRRAPWPWRGPHTAPRAHPRARPADAHLAGDAGAGANAWAPTGDADTARGTVRARDRSRGFARPDRRNRRPRAVRGARPTNDLDERSVRRDVAKRAASAFQHLDTSRRRDPLVKLVQEPALSDARVADDLHDAAVGPASALDVAFEQRQVGLPPDIRCQAGLLRNLEPRLETGFSRHAERCRPRGRWFEHHRRARRRMNVRGRGDAGIPG